MARAVGVLPGTWVYRVASALFNQPRLLRGVAAVVRRSSALSSALSLVASAAGVREVLAREGSFSHGHYPEVMLGGPFLIGLRSGPGHSAKRACLHGLLPTPAQVASGTEAALALLLPEVQRRLDEDGHFDFVAHFMVPLVWNAIRLAYDPAAGPTLEMRRELMLAARWLGAQLLIGSVATGEARQRALRSAVALTQACRNGDEFALDGRWQNALPDEAERHRDAVGLLWVGHPATVQAGAFMLLELMARPEVYARLREEMRRALANGQVGSPQLRERLREHVLELLRFRPPFPLAGRLVPEPAAFTATSDPADAKGRAAAGSMVVMLIGALFDPAAQHEDPDEYLPGRHFHDEEDRWLVFGAGPRHCIAREQVVEILVGALSGLLRIGDAEQVLKANGRRALSYDGPVLTRLSLSAEAGA